MGEHVNGLSVMAIDPIVVPSSSCLLLRGVCFLSRAENMRYKATEARNSDATKRRLRKLTYGFASASPFESCVDSITSVMCEVRNNNTHY